MLPRNASKCVSIGADRYRYAVSEAGPGDARTVPLVITVQHETANGAMLRVTGIAATRAPREESKWYDGRTIKNPVKPSHVVHLIAQARRSGWIADNPGPPFVMVVTSDDIFAEDESA